MKKKEKIEKKNAAEQKDNTILVDTISKAIQIPGVKVNRSEFLVSVFKNADNDLREKILNEGPAAAGCSKEEIKAIAKKLVNERTLTSTGLSFAAGLPGGIAMAGTIPADTIQFYGIALRLAQEISYLYGAEDLWENGSVDVERVTNQLILYCGVMFGVSGASATLKLMASALSKQALKKLPQQALMKTVYYPIIKRIVTFFGVKMTKDIFAKGVSKAIPVVGGIVSGGITLASMRPMGIRLVDSFDEAVFDYTEEDFDNDFDEAMNIIEADVSVEETITEADIDDAQVYQDDKTYIDKIREAKNLLDEGLITDEEFSQIKTKIIGSI